MTGQDHDERPGPPPEAAAPRSAAWRWVRLAITAGLLALVISRLDLGVLAAALSRARLDALSLLILVIWTQRYLAALRWWLLLRCNTPGLPLWSVIRVTFASDFAGQFLPGTVGVEVLRLCGITRVTGNAAGAVSSILVDRLLSTAALAVLVLTAVALAPGAVEVDPMVVVAGGACLALAAVVGAAVMSPRARHAAERLIPPRIAARLESRAARLYASLDQYRGRRGLLALGIALALIFQFVRVVMYYLGAVSLGIAAPFSAFAVFIPIIVFLTLLPISIGGFGVREAAFMTLFATIGVAGEDAVAISLFVYVVHMLCRLPGAWFCAFGPAARRRTGDSGRPGGSGAEHATPSRAEEGSHGSDPVGPDAERDAPPRVVLGSAPADHITRRRRAPVSTRNREFLG